MAESFDEHRWVIQIRRTLDEDHEPGTDGEDVPVSIYNVPKTLMSTNPSSYTPEQVALGPYHHWRPELYVMERYKLAAAKRAQKQLHDSRLKFQALVDQLSKLEHRIRACYHKYLDFNGETLAWMMAMDASFFLEFLRVYAIREGKLLSRVSSRMMSHLVDYTAMKSAHHAILRDLVMLENQIPLFVCRSLLELQFPDKESAEDALVSMLIGCCKELFPFKMVDQIPVVDVSHAHHLLDLLFRMVVPEFDQELAFPEHEDDVDDEIDQDMVSKSKSKARSKVALTKVRNQLIKLRGAIMKLPLYLISCLPGCAFVRPLFFSEGKEAAEAAKKKENQQEVDRPPLMEEIAIPSVSELAKCGVRFAYTCGGISTTAFDLETGTLHLPAVALDVNSTVVLRNLVAYEAAAAAGPLVFTRYTELMNGIIDTEEDVRILRESRIVLNRMKSDKEVADLWNGMSKSIRLTKVGLLDKVIEDVNMYYGQRWRVRAERFMQRYVFEVWRMLTLLAAVLVLFLLALQVFCYVYYRYWPTRLYRIRN